jgi:hypothetical protein
MQAERAIVIGSGKGVGGTVLVTTVIIGNNEAFSNDGGKDVVVELD